MTTSTPTPATAVNTWKPSGPGMTPLPPSPEMRPLSSPPSHSQHERSLSDINSIIMDPLSLGGITGGVDPTATATATANNTGTGTTINGTSASKRSRLRSIARYQAFAPQALACSDPIPSYFSSSTTNSTSTATRPFHNSISHSQSSLLSTTDDDDDNDDDPRKLVQPNTGTTDGSSSLGAVAGAQGVAVFRIDKPHEPLLMLNHATFSKHYSTANSTGTAGGGLAIYPTSNGMHNNQQQDVPAGTSATGKTGRGVVALAFQPEATRSLYLAAARGTGVLIWDVSGHCLSPLLGRLTDVGSATQDYSSDRNVTSLAWKLSGQRDGLPLLATTTSYSACIWDLRTPIGSLASTKPSIRFGTTAHSTSTAVTTTSTARKVAAIPTNNNSNNIVSPFVQIACSRANECATLDAAGTVTVFDIRMTQNARGAVCSLATFAAFAHRGVGISYMPLYSKFGQKDGGIGACATTFTTSATTAWVTWGLDSPDADAVVKVWSFNNTTDNKTVANGQATADEISTSVDDAYRVSKITNTSVSPSSFRLIAQCNPPYHLACARVCPDHVENSIMTIGILDNSTTSSSGIDYYHNQGFRAELWKIRPEGTGDLDANDETWGMERIAAFNGNDPISDPSIETVLGRTKFGPLQAAELAITSHTTTGLAKKRKGCDDDRASEKNQSQLSLTLCCLSAKGFVTTHLIPEALPKKGFTTMDNGGPTPALFSSGGRSKVFNDDKKIVDDAARLWGTHGDQPASRRGLDTLSSVERVGQRMQLSPTQERITSATSNGPQQLNQRKSEIGNLLFEMDAPAVAYNAVAAERLSGGPVGGTPMDLTSSKAMSAAAMIEDSNNAAVHVRDVAAMAERMDNIETDRIPCPRICSAVFGRGSGGLAVFNNGDVKKMWTWFDRAAPARLSNIPSTITAAEKAFSDPGNSRDPGSSAGGQQHDLDLEICREYPRSMKDLMDMTEAAKEAQWGDVDDSGAVVTVDEQDQSSGDNLFEYLSTGSISSDSEEDLPTEIADDGGGKRFENYFGNFRRPLAEPSADSTKGIDDQERKAQSSRPGSPATAKAQVVGPTSDILASKVHVTHDFDRLALNNQSANLAAEWVLGEWQHEDEDRFLLSSENRGAASTNEYNAQIHHNNTGEPLSSSSTPKVLSNFNLPSYRRLGTSPTLTSPMSCSQSGTMIVPVAPADRNLLIENEPGVHGGEYAVRPNMQESMVFLKKLCNHQQDGNSSLIPPDSPAVFRGRPVRGIAELEQLRRQGDSGQRQPTDSATTTNTTTTAPAAGGGGDGRRLRKQQQRGVFALASDTIGTGIRQDDQKLNQIKNLCTFNATVCEKYNETAKQGVWNLLGRIVDHRLIEQADAYNGWGGKGGGALGVDLISNIFSYYETIGDVQMLATMVCVLSGGRPRSNEGKNGNNGTRNNSNSSNSNSNSSDGTGGQLHLLPAGKVELFDAYIRRYSDLLFGWSLLVKRAELNKHLAQRLQESEVSNADFGGNKEYMDHSRGAPVGIGLVFTCPRCGGSAEFGTNICQSCQDFAFRCSICENGVRGVFMVCDACGHGGHLNHVQHWFSKHSSCPSGCGCHCTFSSSSSNTATLTTAAAAAAAIAGRGGTAPDSEKAGTGNNA